MPKAYNLTGGLKLVVEMRGQYTITRAGKTLGSGSFWRGKNAAGDIATYCRVWDHNNVDLGINAVYFSDFKREVDWYWTHGEGKDL
ncbi:hypothetical protein CcrJ4_gp457 [Caulobacter phage J4]|nr:hypothetical protein CcrJ4_gp457 [Caulobacter phage J4]